MSNLGLISLTGNKELEKIVQSRPDVKVGDRIEGKILKKTIISDETFQTILTNIEYNNNKTIVISYLQYSIIVGQIFETIFQIVIQAPNLAYTLLFSSFFTKKH